MICFYNFICRLIFTFFSTIYTLVISKISFCCTCCFYATYKFIFMWTISCISIYFSFLSIAIPTSVISLCIFITRCIFSVIFIIRMFTVRFYGYSFFYCFSTIITDNISGITSFFTTINCFIFYMNIIMCTTNSYGKFAIFILIIIAIRYNYKIIFFTLSKLVFTLWSSIVSTIIIRVKSIIKSYFVFVFIKEFIKLISYHFITIILWIK